MNKLSYILASIFLISCNPPGHKGNQDNSSIRSLQSVGSINGWWTLKTYHDDLRDNTCYIAISQYSSDPIVMSCVKDNQPVY